MPPPALIWQPSFLVIIKTDDQKHVRTYADRKPCSGGQVDQLATSPQLFGTIVGLDTLPEALACSETAPL